MTDTHAAWWSPDENHSILSSASDETLSDSARGYLEAPRGMFSPKETIEGELAAVAANPLNDSERMKATQIDN